MKDIKNIIFDLGAVILNIDPERTTNAFAAITGRSLQEIRKAIDEMDVFYRYEVGELDDKGFRTLIRTFIGKDLSDKDVDHGWNALLLDFPPARIQLIQSLGKKYRLFLLSNTNAIHYVEVEKILKKDTGYDSLAPFFEKVYLSYEIKMAKPSPEIYKYVLSEQGLKPEETLFIDDNLNNIISASALGIKTIHLQPPTTILDIFK